MEGWRARNVVIEFPPSGRQSTATTPGHQAAKAIRITVADADMVIIDGLGLNPFLHKVT